MYCSRRGIETARPSDACKRCGRCNWEQAHKTDNGSLAAALVIGAGILLAAVWYLWG